MKQPEESSSGFCIFVKTISMKRLLGLIIIILSSFVAKSQTPFKGSDYQFYYQVNIGKTNGTLTTPSAWLEVGKDSTNKGIRIPCVVDTANISAPIYGLQIYQIKDNGMYFRDKTAWRRMIDPGILNFYLRKADSTIFYPYWSNPRGYVSVEADPIANAKTVRWIAGTGINVSNGAAQALSTNPVATISAQNTTAIWNANQFQGVPVSNTAPTTGQFLSYNGTQYVPTSPPATGTVTSVGLSLPAAVFDITGSPVTTSGTLTGTFKNQLANLVFASPNGISGTPLFRSLTYSDLPISGVVAGPYGNDTISTKFTVNDRGILTSAGTSSLSSFFIRNSGAFRQTGNYAITGYGVLNNLFTNAGTGGSSQSHISMRAGDVNKITIGLTGIESGTNSGSDLIINRWDDSGVFLGSLLYGRRSDGFIGIGNTSPNYKLTVQAGNTYSDGYATSIVNKSTNATASLTNETVLNVTTNGATITLPTAAPGNFGKIYTILKDFTAGRAYVASNSIDGSPTYNLGDTIKGISVISDGAAWKVMSTKNLLVGSGAGSVTSVGLSVPGEFSVSGSPVTSAGTITISKVNQSAGTVYAGPASGGAAAPAFRALVVNDIPKGNNVTTVNDVDYSVSATDDFIICSATITANHTITLPAAGSNTGRILYLVNLETSGSFTYSPSPSLLLNSGAIITGLGNNSSSTIYSDGTNWRLLHESTH